MKNFLKYLAKVLFENIVLGIVVAVAAAIAIAWVFSVYLPGLE